MLLSRLLTGVFCAAVGSLAVVTLPAKPAEAQAGIYYVQPVMTGSASAPVTVVTNTQFSYVLTITDKDTCQLPGTGGTLLDPDPFVTVNCQVMRSMQSGYAIGVQGSDADGTSRFNISGIAVSLNQGEQSRNVEDVWDLINNANNASRNDTPRRVEQSVTIKPPVTTGTGLELPPGGASGGPG